MTDQAATDDLEMTDVDWEDFEKAGHQGRSLLRDIEESGLLDQLLDEALADAEPTVRNGPWPKTISVVLFDPEGKSWRLEIVLAQQDEATRPQPPQDAYSALSLRDGFQVTIYHRDHSGDGALVPSVTRYEQAGSCFTSSESLVQSVRLDSRGAALIIRRTGGDEPTNEPDEALTAHAVGVLRTMRSNA